MIHNVPAKDLADRTLTEVATLIRNRQVSSLEVTQSCLDRIATWNPVINAFLEVQLGRARAEAERCDALLRQGTILGPLHGVPFACKDAFYRTGDVCTAGSNIRAGFVAGYTATVLGRIDRAGAVCLGRLGMAEFAADATGHNLWYGACRNPWHPEYIAGGSSSGSGAALAARLIYGSLGSDTGGSIRLPAAACGVVGLMPTQGRVSRHGAIPRAWTLDRVGPMARSVEDCACILQVIAGPDSNDGMCVDVAVPSYSGQMRRRIRGLTLGAPDGSLFAEASDGIRAALDLSVSVFRDLGVKVKRVPVPDADRLFRLNDLILKSEAAAIHGRWLRTRPDDYAPYLRARIEGGLLVPANRYIEALQLRAPLLRDFLATTMDGVDVLHFPVIAHDLPRLEDFALDADRPETLSRAAALSRFTRLFNYLGVPAMSVPCGFDANGLPIGMQLVGRPFDEGTLLLFGREFERATTSKRPAPELYRAPDRSPESSGSLPCK